MTVFNIQRDWGPNVSIVRLTTDASPEQILQTGWLTTQRESIELVNNGPFEWKKNDVLLISYPGAVNAPDVFQAAFFHIFPAFDSVNPIIPVYPNLQNVVAHAGGGQANASLLNLGINTIITVATQGDSVILPDDVLGQTVIVANRGANAAAIFPQVGDEIDILGVNNPIFIFPDETYLVIGNGLLNWTTVNISPVYPNRQNLTAHAGGGQANALLLNVGISVVTTVATGGDSVVIPQNFLGQSFLVVNLGANNLDVFPPVGAQINALGVNTQLVIAPGGRNFIVGMTPTRLFTFP